MLFTFKQPIELEITIEADSLKEAKKIIKGITPQITLDGNQAAIFEDNCLILGLQNDWQLSKESKNLLREDQE